MVTYEITASVREDLRDAYERYMRERHIPDLLATGCFVAASLSQSAPGRYRVRYEAPSPPALERYLTAHAPRLRQRFADTFPDGVELAREEWGVLATWGYSAAGRASAGGGAKPASPDVATRLRCATPVFLVSDIAATMRWYREKLGFDGDAVPPSPPHNFGILSKHGVEIFLQQLAGYRKPDHYRERPGGVWSAYLQVDGVAALHEALRSIDGVSVIKPLRRQPYGQTEFEVKDPNGYVLVFAEAENG